MNQRIKLLRERRLCAEWKGETAHNQYVARSEAECDLDRVSDCPAKRRLAGKTQILQAGTGDYYSNRMTHTDQVMRLGRRLAQILLVRHPDLTHPPHPGLAIDPQVVECAALNHDLGHPPFGHKGEQVLDDLLRPYGLRFEANAQTFRLLMFLERRMARTKDSGTLRPEDGLNLTAAVLLATLKYPYSMGPEGGPCITDTSSVKGLYAMEWEMIGPLIGPDEWDVPPGCCTLESQAMTRADDIAYACHDVQDGIRAGKITPAALLSDDILIEAVVGAIKRSEVAAGEWPAGLEVSVGVRQSLRLCQMLWQDIYREAQGDLALAGRAFRAHWVDRFLSGVGIVRDGNWKRVTFVRADGTEDPELVRDMAVLKALAWVALIKDVFVQRTNHRNAIILRGLWHAFMNERYGAELFPPDWRQRHTLHERTWLWPRLVADYLAGMTDSYATQLYQDMYGTGAPPAFDGRL